MKPIKCVICGEGTYTDMNIRNTTDLHNSGLGVSAIGSTAWRATACDRCGNVQVFRFKRSEEQMRSRDW
ncbi:MAG TPA: hypothetical protein VHX14_18590 [Thermoanaerobaculia bacterium]|jgi:predicted nucleic-acid-binding Zn-ribbon protein|nr:hypothetical protein [Thermoanaerobaculia bacterium]